MQLGKLYICNEFKTGSSTGSLWYSTGISQNKDWITVVYHVHVLWIKDNNWLNNALIIMYCMHSEHSRLNKRKQAAFKQMELYFLQLNCRPHMGLDAVSCSHE